MLFQSSTSVRRVLVAGANLYETVAAMVPGCSSNDRVSRQGGRNQRHKARVASPSAASPSVAPHCFGNLTSSLAKVLVSEWSWGFLSAPTLQKLAKSTIVDQKALLVKASQDGKVREELLGQDLVRIAAIGAEGKYPGNCHRDLVTVLGKPSMPQPFQTTVTVKVHKPKACALAKARLMMHRVLPKSKGKGKAKAKASTTFEKQVKVDVSLPHDDFHHLYTHHRNVFNRLFLSDEAGDIEVIKRFWKRVQENDDPRLDGCDMTSRQDWMSKALPIAVHGDSVPCLRTGRAGTQSLDVYSWHGLLCSGTTLFVKMYIIGVFLSNCTTTTMTEVARTSLHSE